MDVPKATPKMEPILSYTSTELSITKPYLRTSARAKRPQLRQGPANSDSRWRDSELEPWLNTGEKSIADAVELHKTWIV
jgi:hypothetical protein